MASLEGNNLVVYVIILVHLISDLTREVVCSESDLIREVASLDVGQCSSMLLS